MKPLIALLSGAGQPAAAWDDLRARLGDDAHTLPLSMADLVDAEFTLDAAVEGLHRKIRESGARSCLVVGLSVGGMIATRYAARYPDQVRGLLLSGSQLRPNPLAMGLQRGIMRALPARLLPLPERMDKARFIQILDAAARTDLRAECSRLTMPTTVLCGSKDPFNIPAARTIAATLPDSELHIVPGGGHELNTDKPEEFHHAVMSLMRRSGSSAP